MKKLKSKLFVDAAKSLYKNYLQNLKEQTLHDPTCNAMYNSYYSCDIIRHQPGAGFESNLYSDLYAEYFHPKNNEDGYSFAWWPKLPDGTWDYESRFIALLLMAEITKDLNRNRQ